MPTELARLRTLLLHELDRELKPLGYALWASRQMLRRTTPDGWISVHVSFINHTNDFDVVLGMSLRIAAVEILLDGVDPLAPKDSARWSSTFGAELGNIEGTGQRRWSITASTDVAASVRTMRQAITSIGEPFLSAYEDKERLLSALSSDDAEGRLGCPLPEARAFRALAMAHVLGRQELHDGLTRRAEIVLRGNQGAMERLAALMRNLGKPQKP